MKTDTRVALITGAAKRVGAVIAKTLHAAGMNVIIHCKQSVSAAQLLAGELNNLRANSAVVLIADLNELSQIEKLAKEASKIWQRIDVLINNASTFYPTPLGKIEETQWHDLMNSNCKAPLFLSQALFSMLSNNQGCIVNITDIHAERPLRNYPVYCAAKAGLLMLTHSLAKEMAPNVRVNAVAPGAILWPTEENELNENIKKDITDRIALRRKGDPADIAQAVLYLINANYVTGEILHVDGGRLLNC